MAEEQWKPIKGFEGVYEISSFGRLKSYRKSPTGRILKNTNKKGDYIRVVLSNKKIETKASKHIHRLVYENFIGEIPDGYHIHHKDGDNQNNRIDNLELLSPSEHHTETARMNPHCCDGMRKYNMYERPREIHMYDLDGNYLASFPNSKKAEIVTGVCQRNILQVANKTEFSKGRCRKQAGGYIWSFEKNENYYSR